MRGDVAPDDQTPTRPLPAVTPLTEPYWTGGARGRLTMQRCRRCRRISHPPSILCRYDHSPDLEWEDLSGRGVVESWTENHHQWFPGIEPPYLVALVAIAEDRSARLLTSLVDIDAGDVTEGLEVQVRFEECTDDEGTVWLPVFGPVGGS